VAERTVAQILLTEATRSLLDGHDLGELELLDLGEHRLSDGVRPIRLYQLIVPDLDDEFPPLPTSPTPRRHQLPT
jgi:class 3 adenylate cyclase